MRHSDGHLAWAVAIALFCTACARPELKEIASPQIKGVEPRIVGLDFHGVDLAFDVDLYNPNPIDLRSPYFRYQLDVDGQEFITSEATSQAAVPAAEIGRVTLPVRISYSNMMHTFQRLADLPEVSYHLQGTVIVAVEHQSFKLPFTLDGKFPVLLPLEISDIEVRQSDSTLTKARLIAEAKIRNPNAFPVGVKKLGYILQLGTVKMAGLTASTAGKIDPGEMGPITLTGEVSTAGALFSLLTGGRIGEPRVFLSGTIQTPYGNVQLPQ